jgi:micrococcal nuclease
VRVEDGDTVVVEGGTRVRYLAVDAPEKDEPFHREATSENRRLVEGKTVELSRGGPDEADRYGRTLAVVRTVGPEHGAVCVNEALVRAGLASVYITAPDAVDGAYLEALLEAQRDAIAARRGVWASRLAKEPPPGTLVSTRFRVHRADCPEAKAGKPRPVASLAGELAKGKSLCRTCNPLQ